MSTAVSGRGQRCLQQKCVSAGIYPLGRGTVEDVASLNLGVDRCIIQPMCFDGSIPRSRAARVTYASQWLTRLLLGLIEFELSRKKSQLFYFLIFYLIYITTVIFNKIQSVPYTDYFIKKDGWYKFGVQVFNTFEWCIYHLVITVQILLDHLSFSHRCLDSHFYPF